jgi:hypothetical protein
MFSKIYRKIWINFFIAARSRGGNYGHLRTVPAGEPAFSESPVFTHIKE